MAEHSVPAIAENISKGLALIDRQVGGGGTELLPALKKAFGLKQQENYSRTVVIATDGFINVEAGAFDLIRNRLGSANVFAFGIGTSVNRHLIEGMAAVGMAESFVITRPEEAPSKAERFRAIIQSPTTTTSGPTIGKPRQSPNSVSGTIFSPPSPLLLPSTPTYAERTEGLFP